MVEHVAISPPPIRRRFVRLRYYRLPLLLLLVLAATYAAALRWRDWQADRAYARAAAEVDRLDPGWRLNDILANRAKIPDAENSALRVAEIVRLLPPNWPGAHQYDASLLSIGSPPERLEERQRAAVRAALEPVSDALPLARTLSDFPSGSYHGCRPMPERFESVGPSIDLTDLNFPYGEELRRVLFLLRIDALQQIDERDLEVAVTDVRAMIDAGRSIGDFPGVSAQQARNSACWMAIPQLERMLAQAEAPARALSELQALLENEARHDGARIAMRGERAIADDVLEQIHSGRFTARAIPYFDAVAWWERSLTDRTTLRNDQVRLLRLQSRAVTNNEQSNADKIEWMKVLTDGWVADARAQGFLARRQHLGELLLLGRFPGIPTWFGMHQANLRTAIVALAVERYRLDQQGWPESIDQLIPGYLEKTPADPFANGPIQLRRLPDGLVIYSVGFDRIDDGGRVDPQTRNGPDQGFRLWDLPVRSHLPDSRNVRSTADDSSTRH
jgi:hypothetical protein